MRCKGAKRWGMSLLCEKGVSQFVSNFQTSAVFCTLTILSTIPGGDAHAQSLNEAVRIAINSAPEMLGALETKAAAREDYIQTKGGLFPNVNLRGDTGWSRNDSQEDGTIAPGAQPLINRQLSLSVSQILFDGGATLNAIDQGKYDHHAAIYDHRQAVEDFALQTVEAYIEVLRQRRIVALSRDNVQKHEEISQRVERFVRSGRGKRADADQVEGRLSLAQATLLDVEGRLSDANATFARFVGAFPVQMDLPEASFVAKPTSLEEALVMAYDNNALLNATLARVDSAKAAQKQEQSGYYPNLSLQLSADEGRNVGGTSGRSENLSAQIVMTYNLFNGGATSAADRAAGHRVNEARYIYNTRSRQIEENLRLAWNAVETAKRRLDLLKTYSRSSARVRDAYVTQFALGQRTLLDVLDSENELFSASTSLVTAEMTFLFGQYQLMAVTNQLMASLNVDYPSRPGGQQGLPGDETRPCLPFECDERKGG